MNLIIDGIIRFCYFSGCFVLVLIVFCCFGCFRPAHSDKEKCRNPFYRKIIAVGYCGYCFLFISKESLLIIWSGFQRMQSTWPQISKNIIFIFNSDGILKKHRQFAIMYWVGFLHLFHLDRALIIFSGVECSCFGSNGISCAFEYLLNDWLRCQAMLDFKDGRLDRDHGRVFTQIWG